MNKPDKYHLQEEAAVYERSGGKRQVEASELGARLPELLDAVEAGETVVFLRNGQAIARISPEADCRRAEINGAIDNIERLGKEIREQHGPMTIDEILSLRHEGHKY